MNNDYQDFPNPLKDIYEGIIEIKNMLIKMQQNQNEHHPINEEDNLLTIKEAAKLLCYSVPSMYRLISEKKIPHFKKGSKLLFKKDELTVWVHEGRRRTLTEIEEDAEKFLGELGVKKNENDLLNDAGLSVRAFNILNPLVKKEIKKRLEQLNIPEMTKQYWNTESEIYFGFTVKDLSTIISKQILLSTRNCGKKIISEIEKMFNERGLSLNVC